MSTSTNDAITSTNNALAEVKAAEELAKQKADLLKQLGAANTALVNAETEIVALNTDYTEFTTKTYDGWEAQSNYVKTNSGTSPESPGSPFISVEGQSTFRRTAYWMLHSLPIPSYNIKTSGGQLATYLEVVEIVQKNPKPSWYTPAAAAHILKILQMVAGLESEKAKVQRTIKEKTALVSELRNKLYLIAMAGPGATSTSTDPDEGVEDLPLINPVILTIAPHGQNASQGAFNPPPHAATRSITAPALRLREPGQYWGEKGRLSDEKVLQAFSNNFANRLGYMYQDPDFNVNQRRLNKKGVAVDDPGIKGQAAYTVPSKDGKPAVTLRDKTQLWGFQFTYNPSAINQTLSVDVANDWTLQDPAAALTGTGVISFDLYINRIMDFQVLKYGTETQTGYARKLTVTDVNGILTRGTNYDLEYFFRVVNGDPTLGSPLLDTGDPTSDFGYVTGVPVWINFGGSQRYKVSLRSIGIQHVVFNKDMIPMLTMVKMEFARIPTFGDDTVAVNNKADIAEIVAANKAAADAETKS